MPDVAQPIFIVGTGRCGSTVFHHLLSFHDHVAWLSPCCQKHPERPQLNRRAMRLLDLPLVSRFARKRVYPVEAYAFWERYCPGFAEPYKDLVAEDLSNRVAKSLRGALSQIITRRRPRLLIKVTGWPRIGFLQALYPDARFIHVYRDGRAVANSLLNIHFWSGWRGPDNWRWGQLTPEQRECWLKHNRSFAALAGIAWETLMAAQDKAKETIPAENLLEVRYETMCADPMGVFRQAAAFLDLEWTPGFEATIANSTLRNTNHKWQEDLNETQKRALSEALQHALPKYGYS